MPGAYVQGAANGGKVQYTPGPKRDVYGILRSSATLPTPHGFVGGLGHPTDSTGLIYMRARYYDPGCGRFISEDPGDDGQNWYGYSGDNPVNTVDDSGKDANRITQIILAWLAGAYSSGYIYERFLKPLTKFGTQKVGDWLISMGENLLNGGERLFNAGAVTMERGEEQSGIGNDFLGAYLQEEGGSCCICGVGEAIAGAMLILMGQFVQAVGDLP